MFWITHRSGQVIMNPVLIAFGWRPYELEYRFGGDDTEYTSFAFVHGYVVPGESHLHMPVQDILIIKPQAARGD
jgi:hypothetical protein